MRIYKTPDFEIAYEVSGAPDGPAFLWAHGWGQGRAAFRPLAQSFENAGMHYFIDFPGFGDSPAPHKPIPPHPTLPPMGGGKVLRSSKSEAGRVGGQEAWGTAEYADAMAAFIESEIKQPVIWVGHSFGCRVGIQIASRRPDLIKGMCLIAGAGLKRKRPLHKKIYMTARIGLFKSLKKLITHGLVNESWLYKTFGSADYRNAGPMRSVFVKTVNEDLSDIAKTIQSPVILIYGSNDTETPPEIGRRLNKLITGSEYIELPGLDHYSVLGAGRHPVAAALKKFINGARFDSAIR